MPELTSSSSGPDSAPPVGQPTGRNGQPAASPVDPFENLYKMSTTAGLGSGDYVAVNGTAIAAVFLGIASALVLFRSPFLLIIPLIGIICSVLAFLQISKSNGTQTGREAALVGLLLCLGLGGFIGVQSLQIFLRQNADKNTLNGLIKNFGDDIRAGDQTSIANAYEMCDSAFRNRVSLADFDAVWQRNRHSALFGDLTGMESSGVFNFEDDQVSGEHLADGEIKVNFARTGHQPFRMRMGFRYVDNSWKFDLIEIFPTVKAGETKAPGSPPGRQQPVVPANSKPLDDSSSGRSPSAPTSNPS